VQQKNCDLRRFEDLVCSIYAGFNEEFIDEPGFTMATMEKESMCLLAQASKEKFNTATVEVCTCKAPRRRVKQ